MGPIIAFFSLGKEALCLVGVPAGLEPGRKQQVGGKVFRRGRSIDSTEDGRLGREGCHGCSSAELAMRLEDWIWRNGGSHIVSLRISVQCVK